MIEGGPTQGLMAALGLRPREHIAVVGGGGKTSLCFALARELQQAGKRVLTTTTTKVWQTEAAQATRVIFCTVSELPLSHIKKEVGETGHVFVAVRPLDSGKVEGIEPETANLFFEDHGIDYVIVEADGAQGRPVKAPASHEPVIPSSVSLVIAVVGLEALGKSLGPDIVFRLDRFKDVAGLDSGDEITPQVLTRLLCSPNGPFKGSPGLARRVVFLNKSDLLNRRQDALRLVRRLTGAPRCPFERVIIGSLRNNIYEYNLKNSGQVRLQPHRKRGSCA